LIWLNFHAVCTVFTEEIQRLALKNDAQELSKRQSERARKPRLQPAILAAARHYRAQGKGAKEAWRAIKQKPYVSSDGETVFIDTKEMMRVRSRHGAEKRSGIKFAHWRQSYWPAARVT